MCEFTAKTKPRKCPQCGSGKVARILWGMPAYSRKLQKDLDDGRIVWGAGVDPSIEMAGLKALVSAWNLLR